MRVIRSKRKAAAQAQGVLPLVGIVVEESGDSTAGLAPVPTPDPVFSPLPVPVSAPPPHVWVTNRLRMFLPGRDFPAYLAPHMGDTVQFQIPIQPNKWGIAHEIITANKATPELITLFEKRIAAMFRRYGLPLPGQQSHGNAEALDDDDDEADDPMAEEMRLHGASLAVQMTDHCRAILKAWEALLEAVNASAIHLHRVIDPKQTQNSL